MREERSRPDLTKEYHSAESAAQRPSSHLSASEHDATMRQLEHQQYSLGKQLNEEQNVVAKKEIELGKLKSEREDLGRVEVGEDAYINRNV